MNSINNILSKDPLPKIQRELRRSLVLNCFSMWINEQNFNDWHLSIYQFARVRPLKYFNPSTVDVLLSFLNEHTDEALEIMCGLKNEVTHSIFSLLREGSSWGNELNLSIQDPKDILSFERIWHPEYQRYSEHIFNHLIRIPLGVLGNIKCKNYQDLQLGNKIKILQNNRLEVLTKGFDSTIRNAISHGSISFGIYEIEYIDSKEQKSLTASDFLSLFDELVDTCNSIIISIMLFLCNNKTKVEKDLLDRIPLGIKFLLVDSFTSHTGLEIISMVNSKTIDGRSQLNIACKINSLSRLMQMFEGLSIAQSVIKLGGKNYNRIAINYDCQKSISSSLFLNADKLREAIYLNQALKDCLPEIIETSLLWFDSSNFRRRVLIWQNIIKQLWRKAKREIINDWRKRGLKVLSSRYLIRHMENKSSGSMARVEAYITLKEKGEISEELILDIVKHALKRIKRRRLRIIKNLGEKSWVKRKPVYVWIWLYSKDARIRFLTSSGWSEDSLILRAEWFSKWRNNGPIVVKEPSKIFKKIRIEYNPILFSNQKK